MEEKKAVIPARNPDRDALIIRERLAFIGRTMDRISPKTELYKKLQREKDTLRQKLKQYPKAEYSFQHWANKKAA